MTAPETSTPDHSQLHGRARPGPEEGSISESGSPLAGFVLALSYGGTMFLGVAAAITDPRVVGHTEHVETILYLVAFGCLLPLAILLARWRARTLEPADRAAFAGANLTALAGVLFIGRVLFDSGGSPRLREGLAAGVAAIALANLFAPHAIAASASGLGARPPARTLLVALVAGALFVFVPAHTLSFQGHRALLVFAVVLTFLLSVRGQARRPVIYLIDGAFVLLIVLAASDFNSYGVAHNFDQDFYLAPANAILHGQAMLVGTFAQYGVGVMDFLALIFRVVPVGYGGFQLVNGTLTCVQFIVVYAVLRLSCREQFHALVGTALCVVAAVSTGLGPVGEYASTGPLRFGLPWLLIFAAVVKSRRSRGRRLVDASMLGVVAVAAVWSFETFVYVLVTALAIVALDAALAEGSGRDRTSGALRRLGVIALVVVGAQSAFALATRVFAGAWPDWGGYFAYLRLYSTQGFATQTIAPWSLGYLLAALYFASFAGLVFLISQRRALALAERVSLTAIAGTSAYGLLAYTYFLGRSDPNNLHHVAPPAIAVAALWLGLVARYGLSEHRIGRVALFACAAWGAAALVTQIAGPAAFFHGASPVLGPGLSVRLGPIRSLVDERPGGLRAVEGATLLDRFARGESRVTVVLGGSLETATLIRAKRGNLLPIGDPIQDELLPTRSLALVRSALHELKPNAVVLTQKTYLAAELTDRATAALAFLSRPPSILPPVAAVRADDLETAVLGLILQRFEYRAIASTPSGLVVLRLGVRRS